MCLGLRRGCLVVDWLIRVEVIMVAVNGDSVRFGCSSGLKLELHGAQVSQFVEFEVVLGDLG